MTMATTPMLSIPLKVVVVRDMPVPHSGAPGYFVDFAAVAGNSSGKYLFRKDFPSLTDDEFLQKGLDELSKGEEQAFVAVYVDESQAEIERLVFKRNLDTMYKKPGSLTGQQVYVLDKELIPQTVLCSPDCEDPIPRGSIDAWMSEDDAKRVIEETNRLFFNEFGINFELKDQEVVTSYLRNALPEVSETLDYLGTVKRPPANDLPAKNADRIKRRSAYNIIVDNLYLDQQGFANKLLPDEKAVNLYFFTFTGNTRQGNAGVGQGSSSEKIVMGQWTNKPTIDPNDDDSLLRQRKIYVKEGTPSLTFTAAHELGHILDTNHTGTLDFMNAPQSLLVANEQQIEVMRDAASALRTSFGLPEAGLPEDDLPGEGLPEVGLPEAPLLNEILGTAKKDKLIGTTGNDQILGMLGNDKLVGLAGDDVLNGGGGRDKIFGGSGADTFIVSGGRDIVKDFSPLDRDTIILQNEVYSLKTSGKGRNVKLIFGLGSVLFKNALVDDVEAAIVVDATL